MRWKEFINLLVGIGGDTALGRIVRIRSEKDGEIMKNWTAEERRIYRDWQRREMRNMTQEDYDKQMQVFSNMFKAISASQRINK